MAAAGPTARRAPSRTGCRSPSTAARPSIGWWSIDVQDNYTQPVEPTDSMTFATWGITDFTVQGWNGASWIDLATVTGNNLVKRTRQLPGDDHRSHPHQRHRRPQTPAPTSPRSKPGTATGQERRASDRMEHVRARRAAHRPVHDGIAAAQPDPLADARGSAAAIQRQRLPADSLRLAADHVREHRDRSGQDRRHEWIPSRSTGRKQRRAASGA